jgi:PAS domain S-box-containing protein
MNSHRQRQSGIQGERMPGEILPVSAQIETLLDYALTQLLGRRKEIRVPQRVLAPPPGIVERERARELGERQFQMLADAIPQLVWTAAPDGRMSWFNQRWYDYTGTTFEEMQGRGWQSVHDPRGLPEVLERWEGCLAAGEPFDMAFPLKDRNGVFRPFLTRVVPIKDANGEVECWFGTNTEVTEPGRTAAAADDVIITKSLDGIVRSWNPAAEIMLGYRAEEIIGESVTRLIPEDRRDEEAMILARVAGGERVVHLETVRRRKNGSLLDVSLTVAPIRDHKSNVVGALKTMRDITGRKHDTEQLRARDAELEERVAERTAALAAANVILGQKNDEVEAFVYIVSHDLRAPLVNIQGFANEISRGCGSLEQTLRNAALGRDVETAVLTIVREDIAGALRYINASTLKFQRLIDTLLLLCRTGKEELRLEEADVRTIVDSTILSLRQTIRISGAEVIAEALPGFRGDVTAIGQVFSNLISNALKYLKPGRPGRIVIGGEILNGTTHYWVRDNGSGIPASVQPRLFQVFQRFHPDLASGDGMGLAIVKRLVERHGGRVWAESEEGVGTTFHVELPVQENLS